MRGDTVDARATAERTWPSASFRWLWAASATSLLGSEVGELAIPLFALVTLHASPAELATLRLAQFAPFLVLALVLGVVVDRMRRKPLLIVADLCRGAVLLSIVVFAAAAHVPIWLLVVAVAMVGSMTVLSQLADFSFLPAVVPADRLADANARLSATQSAMSVAGSGVGGLAVQALTAPVAIVVNAVTYLASAGFVGRVAVREPATARQAAGREPAWVEARAGVAFVVRDRVIRALAGEAATWNFFNEVLRLGLTLHVVAVYSGYGPVVLGGLLVLDGLGAVAGATLAGAATRRFGYGRSLLATLLVGNTALAATAGGSAGALLLYGGALALSGFGCGLANAQAVTVRQLATTPQALGRVNAAYRFLSWGMVALGAAAAGVVTTVWGAFPAVVVGAAGMALATLWVVLSPVRSLRGLTER